MTDEPLTMTNNSEWLEGLEPFDEGNRNAILAVLATFGFPKRYLDVGCGTGAMVRTARALGIDAYGVDQWKHPEDYFYSNDLRYPFDMARLCELVTCIEVVEHLEPEYEGVISDTLARHIAPGGRLVLTSAPPGQPGYHHVNCQPKKYWRDRMETRGLYYLESETRRLAEVWQRTWMSTHHLELNLQVFWRPQ